MQSWIYGHLLVFRELSMAEITGCVFRKVHSMPSKCEFLFFMNFDPHPNSNFFADFRCILVLLCYEIGSAWPEKVAQFFQKLPKSCHSSFYLKDMCFKRAHSKVAEHLGYFCKKLCHQDVSKMAQSDHTKEDPRFFPLLFKFCPNSVTSQDAVVFSLSITEIYKLYISVLSMLNRHRDI